MRICAASFYALYVHAGRINIGAAHALIHPRRRERRDRERVVHRADGDDFGTYARRSQSAYAAVSRRAHHGDAASHEHFGSEFQRIRRLGGLSAEAHDRDLYPKPPAVVEQPLHPFEDLERTRLPARAYHFYADHGRGGSKSLGRTARKEPAARRHSRDESPVPVVVIRELPPRDPVLESDYPVPRQREVRVRRDAGVHDAQRHPSSRHAPCRAEHGGVPLFVLRIRGRAPFRPRLVVRERGNTRLRGHRLHARHTREAFGVLHVAANADGVYEREHRDGVHPARDRAKGELPRHPHQRVREIFGFKRLYQRAVYPKHDRACR